MRKHENMTHKEEKNQSKGTPRNDKRDESNAEGC